MIDLTNGRKEPKKVNQSHTKLVYDIFLLNLYTFYLLIINCITITADQGDITAQKITELNQKSINYESHGMGTVITKQIIKLHQGEIVFLDNHPGLKVTISLPLVKE